MGQQSIEEAMGKSIGNLEEGESFSRRMVDAAEKLIGKASSWEKKTVVESLSGYLQDRFEEGKLDFRELLPEKRLAAARIMYSPEEYCEDVLLGETPRLGMEFLFPYHLFPKGSRVVIYGAGNAGRVMYRQAKRDGYVKIAGIVDRNMAGSSLEDMAVRSVREIFDVKFDYVLISLRELATAEAIKASLVSMGVPETKIRWDGDVYHRDNFYRKFYLPMMKDWKGSRESYEEILMEQKTLPDGGTFDHVFPYHLFHEGEKVVIYGAGDIGKKFWKQGIHDEFVEIAGIVDRNWADLQGGEIPIRSVEALGELSFDSVLISVHGPEEVIQSIRETLESMGISGERIKWDGRTYHQYEFRRNLYLNMVRAIGSDFRDSAEMLGTLCRRIDTGIYEHVFPYRFFRKGERIAIYGAGNIGQNLYRQARRYGYVDVVAIVDPHPEACDAKDIPVLPLDAIRKAQPESVLMAVGERDEARAARDALLGMGIAEDKLLWDEDGYLRDADTQKYLEALAQRTEEELEADRKDGRLRERKEAWEAGK